MINSVDINEFYSGLFFGKADLSEQLCLLQFFIGGISISNIIVVYSFT